MPRRLAPAGSGDRRRLHRPQPLRPWRRPAPSVGARAAASRDAALGGAVSPANAWRSVRPTSSEPASDDSGPRGEDGRGRASLRVDATALALIVLVALAIRLAFAFRTPIFLLPDSRSYFL